MADDLEILSELPDGTLRINLLNGQANHSIVGTLELHIAKEIRVWIEQQGMKEGIDTAQLLAARLEVVINTNKVATNKKKVVMFSFDCSSYIKTSEVEYKSQLSDVTRWYSRVQT